MILVATTLVGAFGVVPAEAAPRVAVVSTAEATSKEGVEPQLRAELEAAGFEVVLVGSEGPTSRDTLEATARRTDSFAAIAVVRSEITLAVDVWVTDRVTGKTVLRRIDAGGDAAHASSIIALRAVELLRASLIELNLPDRPKGELAPESQVKKLGEIPRPAALEKAPAPRPAPPATAPAAKPSVSLAIGGELLAAPGGMPLAVTPGIEAWLWVSSSWQLGIRALAPAISTLSRDNGSATLDQELVLGSIRFMPLEPGSVEPMASLGLGAYRLGVRGTASPPYSGRSDASLCFASDITLGLRINASHFIGLVPRVGATWLAPRPVLRFAGSEVAHTGRPLIHGGIAAEVSW